MSNSVRPHRQRPTRLPHPWDSPGKNTGVGCHFLLQCRKVKSESEVAQSCPTLSNPMVCSRPGSSVHGIFQARVLEWGAIAFSSHLAGWCVIVNIYWGSRSSRSCLVHHLEPIWSNLYMLCPWAMSFFQRLCYAPFPPISKASKSYLEKGKQKWEK